MTMTTPAQAGSAASQSLATVAMPIAHSLTGAACITPLYSEVTMTTNDTAKTPQKNRRRISQAERTSMIAQVMAGATTRDIALSTGVSQSAVQGARSAALALMTTQDYRAEVIAQARVYAERAWESLAVSQRVLTDEQWLRDHPAEAFSLASAHRVLAETLGRILSAAS